MAVDDLVLEAIGNDSGAFVGFGGTVNITLPANEIVVTSSSQASSVWSALSEATPDYRIRIADGITLSRTTSLTWGDPGASGAIHMYCPDGTATLDFSGTTTEAEIFVLGPSDNVFLGNLQVLQGTGDLAATNNGHTVMSWGAGSDLLYVYHCLFTVNASQSPNAPENLLFWRNANDNSADRYTFHGVWSGPNVAKSKMLSIADNHDNVANNVARGTWYRSGSETRQRSPIVGGDVSIDFVNCYWPNQTRNHAIHQRDTCNLDVRGCYFGNTASVAIEQDDPATFPGPQWQLYAPTSGAGTDNNTFGSGTPTTTSSSAVITKTAYPATLTPVSFTLTEAGVVQSESGPGNFQISLEPPETTDPSPNSAAHNAWRAFARNNFRQFLAPIAPPRAFVRWLQRQYSDPTDERTRFMAKTTFMRWSTPMNGWVEDYLTSYPGLWVPPKHVPQRQSF